MKCAVSAPRPGLGPLHPSCPDFQADLQPDGSTGLAAQSASRGQPLPTPPRPLWHCPAAPSLPSVPAPAPASAHASLSPCLLCPFPTCLAVSEEMGEVELQDLKGTRCRELQAGYQRTPSAWHAFLLGFCNTNIPEPIFKHLDLFTLFFLL